MSFGQNKVTILFIVSLLAWLSLRGATIAGDPPVEAQSMEAVARVFVHAYGLSGSHIELNDSAVPPWSEARIKTHRNDLFLESRGDPQCHYDLGYTVVERENGVETIGRGKEIIASVSFGLLSTETETETNREDTFVTVFGMPGAVCDNRNANYGKSRCSDRLIATLMPDTVREYLRALRFVFSHVCKPSELPLGR